MKRWTLALAALGIGGISLLPARALAGADDAPAPAPAPANEAPPLQTLDRAVAAGLLSVEGRNPESYRKVDLVLTSRSEAPLRLDLAGRHLQPRGRSVQRLGLSHPVTPVDVAPQTTPGAYEITLAPHEKRHVQMNCCCMDSGKPAPGRGDAFALASEPTPESVEVALRWWVDHPSAPQHFVNTAIWQRDPALLANAWTPTPDGGRPTIEMPKGMAVRSHGGTLYFVEDGTLTSVDPEGIRRFHGTGVFQVFPSTEGLYASGMSVGGRDLWRFATTGEPPWMRITDLPNDPVLGVWSVSGGAFVWSTPSGVFHLTRRDAAPTVVLDKGQRLDVSLGALDPAHGRFVVVAHEKGTPKPGPMTAANLHASAPKFVLYDLDGRTGRLVERKTLENVRSVAAGPAGVFVVTLVGRLERLEGDRLERASAKKEFARIVCVGKSRLVVAFEDGSFASVALPSGAATPIATLSGEALGNLSVDPLTDDLLWIEQGVAKRLQPGSTEPEVVRDENR